MAKKSEEPKEVKPKNVSSFLNALRKNTGSTSFKDSKYASPNHFIDTGNFALNRICSGSVFKGIPSGIIVMISGSQQSSKTLQACTLARNAQQKNNYDAILWFDAEGGAPLKMLENVGVDTDKVEHILCRSIEDTTVKILAAYNNILEFQKSNPDFRCLMILDSIGALTSFKVLNDAANNKVAQDMGLFAKHCLDKDTLVLLSNGNYCKLQDVSIGDIVVTHLGRHKPILEKWNVKKDNYIELKVKGEIIKLSRDHRLLIKRNDKLLYMEAKKIKNTDKLINLAKT